MTASIPGRSRRQLAAPLLLVLATIGGIGAAMLSLVGSPGPVLLDIGLLAHASGFLAGYLVALMVEMMSRTPLLETRIGSDRLARWHGASGRVFVVLMLVHAASAVASWSISRRVDMGAAFAAVLQMPWLVPATIGTAMFLLVAGLSIRASRRRLSYESWHRVHLFTYLALLLTFGHELAGPNTAGQPVVQVLWTLLFVLALGLVVRYRILRPLELALRHHLRVERVIVEAPDVVSLVIRGRHLNELRAEAGQFFRWRFMTEGTWAVAHPFSLSALADDDLLRVTVKSLGEGSRRIRRIHPGTVVIPEGPYGAMTASRRTRDSVLLVAGGVGITPMRALFEDLETGTGELTLLYRASSATDVVFRDELEEIARRRGGSIVWLVGRSTEPENAITPENLLRLVPDLATRDVYMCASPGLSRSMRTAMRRAGLPRRRLHEEIFSF